MCVRLQFGVTFPSAHSTAARLASLDSFGY